MGKSKDIRFVHCENHTCFKMWQDLIGKTPRGSSEQSQVLGGLFTHLNALIAYRGNRRVILQSIKGIERPVEALYAYCQYVYRYR